MSTITLKRGQGLLWIWITLVISAGFVVALQLAPEKHAGSQVSTVITGLQHKKPAPCTSTGQANCVVIRSGP